MCLFDTTQPTEEAALQSIINVGAPIRKAGFCGGVGCVGGGDTTTAASSLPILYCLTGNETLSLWNGNSSSLLYNSTRQDFLQATTTMHSPTATTGSTSSLWSSMDYLVDAYWDAGQNQLLVLAGGQTQLSSSSSLGNSALFALRSSTTRTEEQQQQHQQQQQHFFPNHNHNGTIPSGPPVQIQHLESMVGGHCGVIRAWCPYGGSTGNGSSSSRTLITTGEDARLCEWHLPDATTTTTHPPMMDEEQEEQQQLNDIFLLQQHNNNNAHQTGCYNSLKNDTTNSLSFVTGIKRPSSTSPSSNSFGSSGSPSSTTYHPSAIVGGGGPIRRRRQRPKTSGTMASPY